MMQIVYSVDPNDNTKCLICAYREEDYPDTKQLAEAIEKRLRESLALDHLPSSSDACKAVAFDLATKGVSEAGKEYEDMIEFGIESVEEI